MKYNSIFLTLYCDIDIKRKKLIKSFFRERNDISEIGIKLHINI